MKQLLLAFSMLFAGGISAQTLQEVNANIQMPSNHVYMNGANSFSKAAACGPDTNGYALAKGTGLQALNLNNATSATASCQYYDAPQALTISGVSFYAWKPDATGGISLNATVQIYAAAPDSTPLGSPLATTLVAVDTNFGTGTLDVLRKFGTFTTPVTVTSAYVVVVSNPSANGMSIVYNSWTAADGGQEWLTSALIGPNWLRGYELNVGGPVLDADVLIEPIVSYNLNASFTVSDPCFSSGLTQNFTNTSSAVVNNRMYNQASFLAIPEVSYTWDYGDGAAVENLVDGTHAYAAAGAYAVTLTDTIYGWTTNCSTDTMITLGGSAPTAAFTSVETGLSSTFTNGSTTGSGATYMWDFGDGATSTLMNPTHMYAAPGAYVACLIVTDGCGADTTCASVTVSCAVPTPAFSFAGTAPTINFTNTSASGSGAMYLWIFGDGNTSTVMDPSHTYAADGNYTVCLVVSDVCGSDSTCQTVVVTTCVNPVSAFTFTGASPTYDFTNTSTTTGTTTYAWDFGDGNTSTSENPSHTYTTNGLFPVVLTVTDSCGSNSFTDLVTVSGIGIDELSLVELGVYPNPSNGIFTIVASAEMKSAYITDLSGKLIFSGNLSGTEAIVNAAEFANGTYFLSIHFADGMNQMVRLEVIN